MTRSCLCAAGCLLLCLVAARPVRADTGNPAAVGLEDLLEQRPGLGPFADLRRWVSGEYEYVKTYRLLDRAYARLRSGDLDGAAADFEGLLELHPQNAQLPLYLAELHVRRGDRDRAVEILEGHLARHPHSGYAAATLGYLYLEQGRGPAAVAYLQQALDAYGAEPEAQAVRANLAELVYANGGHLRALELYLGLRPALPGDPLLAYRIGLTQRHLGRNREAVESFRQALDAPGLATDTRVRVRLELAQALRDGGDSAAAARALEPLLAPGAPGDAALLRQAWRRSLVLRMEAGECDRALGLYPDLAGTALPPQTRAAAGYCALRLGRSATAATIFRRVLAERGLPPAEAARMRMELAALYRERGDLPGAARTLERTLESPGLNAGLARRATLQLAEIRVAQGQKSAARGLLDSVSATAADEYTALRVFQLYLDLGFAGPARDHLRALLGRGGVAPALRRRGRQELAFLLLREGDDAGAAALLKRVATEPGVGAADRSQALRALAEVYVRTGPVEEALRWAQEAWAASPDPEVGLLLGGLERRHGDPHRAEERLVAVRRDATAPGALRRRAAAELGTLFMEQGRTVEAEEALWAVLDADSRDHYALASLRELAKRRGDGEDYLAFSDRLRELGLEDVSYAEVAATAAELGEHRRALAMYRELLEQQGDPRSRSRTLRRMGLLALRLGERGAAVEYLQRAADVAPDPAPEILEQLAVLHIFEGSCAAALQPLDELGRVRAAPRDALRAARCQEQVGNLDAAATAYRRALDLSYTAEAALALAWVQQRQGEVPDAVATLEELAGRPEVDSPRRFEALVSLSVLYSEQGNEGLRRDAARRAAAVLPDRAAPDRALYALVLGARDDPRLRQYEADVLALPGADERQARALRLSVLYEMAGVLAPARRWAAVAVAAKPTALARFRRGVLLYQAGEFDSAQGDFSAALGSHPEAALYLAYVHTEMGRGGLAIDVLETALRRQGNPPELAERMNRQLTHLYLAEQRPQMALDAAARVGTEDSELLRLRARSLLLLGRGAEALDAAQRSRAVSPSLRPTPEDTLLFGDIYRQQERWGDADREYTRYLQRHPDSAAVLYSTAGCRRRAGDPQGSLELLRRAVAAEPGHPTYLLDYGYALVEAGETERAIDVFDTYLEAHPEAANVLEEAGYLNQKAMRNRDAARRLRAAIDQLQAVHPDGPGGSPGQAHLDALRGGVWELEKRFSLAGYVVRSDLGGSGPRAGYRGVIPGQLGVEGGWRPPYLGFRDRRVFELRARVLGSFSEDSWAYDGDTTQLALGGTYKPFPRLNLAASLERLVKIGRHSENNWLLRGMGSHSWGRQLPVPRGRGHAGSVYAELGAYFEEPNRTAAYFEIRDGLRWALSPAWGVIPHGVIDGRWTDTATGGASYLEGGVGVELFGGWGATPHRAHAWRLSAYAQYKVGTFRTPPPGQTGKGYRGPTLGVAVRH